MKRDIPFLIAIFSLLLTTEVLAEPLISISVKAEKEVVLDKGTKRVAADTVKPGDVVFYTLSYVNSGDDAASNAVIDDPVPEGTTYVAGSAFGNDAEITFSIDGGKTFKNQDQLTFEVKLPGGKTGMKLIPPEQYTHIRWTVGVVPAHGRGQVGFQTKVK